MAPHPGQVGRWVLPMAQLSAGSKIRQFKRCQCDNEKGPVPLKSDGKGPVPDHPLCPAN
jgi:hypothetical protein